MLKQRVITAVVLLVILLPALFYPSYLPFAAFMLVAVGAAGWEWARLNGCGPRMALCMGAATVLACALGWASGLPMREMPVLWILAGAVWVLGGALLLRVAVPGWPKLAQPLRLAGGLLMLWVAWLAAVQARIVGINFLLSVLVLVWVADIFAYFAGRTFGLKFTRRKLAPAISPGKSWEGVWGGVVGVALLALAWIGADTAMHAQVPSLYSRLLAKGGWFLGIAVVFLAAMSVVGDLIESLVKRSAGAKDSSALLPGHGGVLDRIDALLPVLPLAMMLVSW